MSPFAKGTNHQLQLAPGHSSWTISTKLIHRDFTSSPLILVTPSPDRIPPPRFRGLLPVCLQITMPACWSESPEQPHAYQLR